MRGPQGGRVQIDRDRIDQTVCNPRGKVGMVATVDSRAGTVIRMVCPKGSL